MKDDLFTNSVAGLLKTEQFFYVSTSSNMQVRLAVLIT